MYYNYGFGYGEALVAILAYFGIIIAFAIGIYIVQSLGLYKMAKNAGIGSAWLAFVPIGSGYVLGLLAERSLYFNTGKQTPLAKINLWLPLGTVLGGIVSGIASLVGLGILGLLFSIILWVASITAAVFTYYCYFYVYKDYAPGNEVLFLLLSIFIPFVTPILFLIYMNVVPMSVTGRQYGAQPKYNTGYVPTGNNGPQGGHGPAGNYGPQGGYPPQNGHGPGAGYQQPYGGYPPQNGPQGPYGPPPQMPGQPGQAQPANEEHKGPEL